MKTKAQISRRWFWTRSSFFVFAPLFILMLAFEVLGAQEAFLVILVVPFVVSLAVFLTAFGLFARALGESAVSWVATIVLIPVLGLLLAYVYLGRKYRQRMALPTGE